MDIKSKEWGRSNREDGQKNTTGSCLISATKDVMVIIIIREIDKITKYAERKEEI